MAHLVTPYILFGNPDGDDADYFYTPLDSYTRLQSITPSPRRVSTSIKGGFGKAWAHVPSSSGSLATSIQIVLGFKRQYMGHVQDKVWEIEAGIGPSNALQPRHLWYADDYFEQITADNIENVGSDVTIEYTGDDEFFSANDYLYYQGLPNPEMIVVESKNSTAGTIIADLQQVHQAGALLFKVNWCYPSARLDSVSPATSSTGRAKITISLTTEGQPLSGTSLPT